MVGLVHIAGHQVCLQPAAHGPGKYLDGGQHRALDDSRSQGNQVMQCRAKGFLVDVTPANIRIGQVLSGLHSAAIDIDAGLRQHLAVGGAVFRSELFHAV